MSTRLLLAAVLLLAPLSHADAQGTAAQRIQAARQHALQSGIPVALLDSKVAEGRAKGIPDVRIAAAVERRLSSLQRARTAMSGGARPAALSPADLNVGADAIEAGADPAAVGRLAQAAAPDRRAMAISALMELVRQGNSSDQALQRVMAALARGVEDLRRLPGDSHGRGQEPGDGGDDARGQRRDRSGGDAEDRSGRGEGGDRGNARGGHDGRGNDNASSHGGRSRGGAPPASVPGRGRRRGHGGKGD